MNILRPSQRAPARAFSRGFTLVELMVAAAIGMIVALALTGAVVATGRQYSMISANITAQNSAQIALSLVDQAGRSAGAGFYSAGKTICPTWNAYNGSALVANNAVFMPVKIISGGAATVSDTLVFTGGSGTVPFAAPPVVTNTTGSNTEISNAGAIDVGDIAVAGAPGSGQPCYLFEVTDSDPSTSCGGVATECRRLKKTAATGNLNNGTFSSNPGFAYINGGGNYGPAVVSRVGTTTQGFRQEAFRVECNSLVRYNAFAGAPAACTSSPLSFAAGVDAIASDIVLMHAQYGISATAASDIVTSWVEPSGTTWGNAAGVPTAANVALIKAIRIVMVARSKEPDGGTVTAATCVNGATTPVTNYGPCSFQDDAAPVIDLRSTTVAAGRNWQNYRYRVHMAIVPLRSVLWSD